MLALYCGNATTPKWDLLQFVSVAPGWIILVTFLGKHFIAIMLLGYWACSIVPGCTGNREAGQVISCGGRTKMLTCSDTSPFKRDIGITAATLTKECTHGYKILLQNVAAVLKLIQALFVGQQAFFQRALQKSLYEVRMVNINAWLFETNLLPSALAVRGP